MVFPKLVGLLFTLVFFSNLQLAQAFDFQNSVNVLNSVMDDQRLDFNHNNRFDYNGHGGNDKVVCKTSHFLKIYKRGSAVEIADWSGPEIANRVLTSCEAVKLPGSEHPIIIFTLYDKTNWVDPTYQYVFYHDGNQYKTKKIWVQGYGHYQAPIRGVSCTEPPVRYVAAGGKDGVLCFFAAYSHGGVNRSALLKIEYNDAGDNIRFEDHTPGSGLPWTGGVAGTSDSSFPIGDGFSNMQRDGMYMMDAAFAKLSTGKHVMITVGQHASIRAHWLRTNPLSPNLIEFTNEHVTYPNKGEEMTEFLRVVHLGENESSLANLPCFYFVGDDTNNVPVPAHIRCNDYQQAGWKTYTFPLNSFSSTKKTGALLNENGDLVIKSMWSNSAPWRTFLVPKN